VGDAVSYDAVKLFLEAVDRAGRFDAEAIRDELAATRDFFGCNAHRKLQRKPSSNQKRGNPDHQERRETVFQGD
jgi:ABC-type branched-subunit amino acid transport system substrate-binding protein